MKSYLLILCFALCMLVTAAGAASIVAPGHPHGGLLPPGSTGVFPVAVGDLENAEGVTFNLTFDNTLLSVEGVVANDTIPGSEVVPHIDNIHGWVNVSVTNSQGITAGENWPLPPLVDITFRATENEGESAVEFAGTPTYSQNFEPVYFDSVYDDGSIAVRDPSTIWAPTGTLAYGQPGTFAVGVDNITGATQIQFLLFFDGSYLIVEDIAPASSGVVITSASANNGIHEYGPVALESLPEEVRQTLQQTPLFQQRVGGTGDPGGLTGTGYTDVVDITFRPTNRNAVRPTSVSTTAVPTRMSPGRHSTSISRSQARLQPAAAAVIRASASSEPRRPLSMSGRRRCSRSWYGPWATQMERISVPNGIQP